MFLELMERSGLSIPYRRHSDLRLANLFGRYAPLEHSASGWPRSSARTSRTA